MVLIFFILAMVVSFLVGHFFVYTGCQSYNGLLRFFGIVFGFAFFLLAILIGFCGIYIGFLQL